MLVAERHDRIVRLVNERGSMRVGELSDLFAITEETIRRDLDHLEELGELRRSHGGAVKVTDHPETPYDLREGVYMEEKKEIAQEALHYVPMGDQILLDASTTAVCLASALPNMRLTVLTNSVKVATELAVKDKITVIVTGGTLSPRSLSLVGPSAEQSLVKYHVSRAFVSCKGIHAQYGLTESNELQSFVKQAMIKIADELIVLADASKFGVQDFMITCGLDRITHIVTNAQTDDALIRPFLDAGVSVVKAKSTVMA